MKYAIIAAGEGSRLAQEGVDTPKPLVELNGESLLHRLVRVFMACEATKIAVICNQQSPQVEACLQDIRQHGMDGHPVPLDYVVKSTPSSMHSFYELLPLLEGEEPFILTTVDTVFSEKEFAEYRQALMQALVAGEDGLMGVTTYIDDEKPLYVTTDREQRITGFRDEEPDIQANASLYVSAGIYGLTSKALTTLKACVARGESRMRNYQRALLRDGLRLKAWPFSKVLDVDHRTDIAKAEALLKETATR